MRVDQKTHAWLCERALEQSGYLVGYSDDILGALHKLEGDWQADQQDVEKHLPAGLKVIGVYGPDADSLHAAAELLQVDYACTPRTGSPLTLSDRKGTVHEVDVVDGLLSSYLVLRFSETRAMRSSDDEPAWEAAYWSAMPGQLTPVAGDEDGGMTIVEALTPGDEAADGEEDASEPKAKKGSQKKQQKKKKKSGGGKGRSSAFKPSSDLEQQGPSSYRDHFQDSSIGPWAELSLTERQSVEDGEDSVAPPIPPPPVTAPLPPLRRLCSELLVYTRPDAPLRDFTSSLVKGLRQLWAQAAVEEQDRPMELLTYHVTPPQCGCVFPLRLTLPLGLEVVGARSKGREQSLVRVAGQEDEEERLRTLRRRLHDRIGLPLNRPAFRTTAALQLAGPEAPVGGPTERLRDVHVGVGASGVQDGRQYLVDGTYLYYHYMQGGLDDRGWGCAYRSLQTIASFFLLNHYTTKPVPTHRQIQQALVDMGDQPPELVGSNQWIGSMEVGYYLDHELGVSWRNIHTSSGPELAEKARELARHFEEHGTPVMMGGGQLAFTILGVDWNERTGQVKFLILDPHYTGGEDLKTIQTKSQAMQGYRATPCGWRSADTFAKHSFYNLCLPSRPNIY